MARAIGVDVGSRVVKLVELDGSPKKFRVVRFVHREIPGDGGAAEGEIVTRTVGEVLAEGKAKKDAIVAAVDSGSVVIREILVPFLEDDQIRRVLKFEAEAHLHSYAIEDVVVDYVKIGEVKDQAKILVFAAPKDRVRERIAHFTANDVDPMHIGLDLAALFNAARASGAFERHPDCVLLDIGAVTTKILFVRGGELKTVRSLRTGAESLTRALAEDLRVDVESARRMAADETAPRPDDLLAPLPLSDDDVPETERSAKELETAIVRQKQDDFLVRLHRETTRSIAAYGADSAITAIYLTGGASLTGGIDARLAERFGKPVIRLDFLGDGDHGVAAADHDRANALLGVALGCALRGLGEENLPVEFRRDELRYTKKFDVVKSTLASTVTLVFLFLFLAALKTQRDLDQAVVDRANAIRDLDTRYVEETIKEYNKVLGESAVKLPADSNDPHAQIPTMTKQLEAMHKHINNDLGYDVQNIPPIRSALSVLNDLFEKLAVVRDQLGFLKIDDLELKQKYVKIRGLVGDRNVVDTMRLELEKLPYVESVTYDPTEVDKTTGRTKFGLTANLVPTKAEGGR